MMLTADDGDDWASRELIMLRLYFVSTCHFPPYVLPWLFTPSLVPRKFPRPRFSLLSFLKRLGNFLDAARAPPCVLQFCADSAFCTAMVHTLNFATLRGHQHPARATRENPHMEPGKWRAAKTASAFQIGSASRMSAYVCVCPCLSPARLYVSKECLMCRRNAWDQISPCWNRIR